MRCTDFGSLSIALAIGWLAAAAPARTQETPPPPACAPDAAQCAAAPAADSAPDPSAVAADEPRIDQPFGTAWLGAPDGDVTLVVFADYACPACRDSLPVIDQLIAQDPRLKVVYRLLDNEAHGRPAALTSLAVAQAGGDWSRFHHALDAAGAPTARTIKAALAASGVDPAKLPNLKDDDIQTLALSEELSRNDNLITDRKGAAIPAWLIGDADARNGFDLATLQAAIAKARADAASARK